MSLVNLHPVLPAEVRRRLSGQTVGISDFPEGLKKAINSVSAISARREFFRDMADLMNWSLNGDLHSRNLFVAVLKAHYGTPSTAVIEVEGSPARLTIFITDLQGPVYRRDCYVAGRFLRPGKRRTAACRLVEKFLKSCGEL